MASIANANHSYSTPHQACVRFQNDFQRRDCGFDSPFIGIGIKVTLFVIFGPFLLFCVCRYKAIEGKICEVTVQKLCRELVAELKQKLRHAVLRKDFFLISTN